MAGLPTFLTPPRVRNEMRERFGDHLIGRMCQPIQLIHVEGADTRFISVLREFSRVSRQKTSLMGLEDQELEEARYLRVASKQGA